MDYSGEQTLRFAERVGVRIPRVFSGSDRFFLHFENRSEASPFTPCTSEDSLLEALSQAGELAACNDTVRFSPACSSFDDSQNDPHAGELLHRTAKCLALPSDCGVIGTKHKMQVCGRTDKTKSPLAFEGNEQFFALLRGFLRKNPGAKT